MPEKPIRARRSNMNQSLSEMLSWEKIPSGIRLQTAEAEMEVLTYSEKTIRIRIRRLIEDFTPHSYAVIAEPAENLCLVSDQGEFLQIQTADLELRLQKSPLRLNFYNSRGELLNEDDAAFGTSWIGDEVSTYKKLQPGERFLGLGEKTGNLDRRGSGYTNWNTDHFGYPDDADPIYFTAPFYLGVHSGRQYGIFFDNSSKSYFNFGASNNRFSSFAADGGNMGYYFISADSVAEILYEYSQLTGRMPLPPKWALGYQQCRYSYYPDTEVLTIARTFREKDIPADVIYLDIHYMDAYKVFTFHPERFSQPAEMVAELEKMGFKVVVIIDPGIKVEPGYAPYEEGKKQDLFLKYPDGSDYEGAVWPGWSHFPDFTNPQTRDWWGDKFSFYTEKGIQGFWNDMNEPATWGQFMPNLIEFDLEGRGASHREARNVYGMEMARATYEGAQKHLGGKRPFILTRAGYAGTQRFSAVWTGDNTASDAHMMAGVRLVNSLGLTGIPFAGYDAGGFIGTANVNLFARWICLAAFSPFFRGHSMINSRDAEPWGFGEEVEEISRNYIRLRYKLMPYLYSSFYESSQSGIPVARSLAIEHPHNEKIYHPAYQNQYLFGPSILVAPVESHKELTKVYLPEGNWYELFRDTPFEGDQEIVTDCPKTTLPLFVKGGAIIPMQSAVLHAGMKPETRLNLHVYKGKGDSEFLYYEDDGESYAFERGEFYRRIIQLDSKTQKIHIQGAEGPFPTHFRYLRIYLHGFNQLGETVRVNGVPVKVERDRFEFVAPISSFDPLGIPSGTELFMENLPWVDLGWVKEEVWVELI
ncbi:MAG: glycoside hydrolase family 31 protein [Bacteroidia bacterium]|nr:glycoside hydrolase family 31 protein [Bacteroidia bacterium]